MSRTLAVGALGFVAATTLFLGACSDNNGSDSGSNDSTGNSASNTSDAASGAQSPSASDTAAAESGSATPNGAQSGGVQVDEAKARQLAQDALPGGSVQGLALDRTYQPNPTWDVAGTDAKGQKRRLDIDAVTGEVVKNEAATY